MKSPIVIYDSRAMKALNTTKEDIPAYYSKWRKQFDLSCDEINAACASLPKVYEYAASDAPTPQYVKEIASQPWFRERVFDVYLWSLGG